MKKLLVLLITLSLLLCSLTAMADEGAVDVVMSGDTYHLTLTSVEIVDGKLTVVIEGFGSTLRMGGNGWMVAAWPVAHFGGEELRADNVNATVGGPFTFTFERDALPDEIWMDPYDEGEPEALIWSADASVGEAGSAEAGVAVGDTVCFGHYKQSWPDKHDPAEIEWAVLDVRPGTTEGDRGAALLLSRYALERLPYEEALGDTHWETCSLRKWLNGEFLNTAFTGEEQDAIVLTAVDNSDAQGCPDYDTDGGPDTEDKVFLLSYSEAWSYLTTNIMRTCMPTMELVIKQDDLYIRDSCPWWLRSPGQFQIVGAFVGANGKLFQGTTFAMWNYVRPALWVDLNTAALTFADGEKQPEAEAEPEDLSWIDPSLAAGDTLPLGHWEQDNNLPNGPEAIEWIVLESDGEVATLISECALDVIPYYDKGDRVTWDISRVRKWLNSDFLNDAFTGQEQALLQQVTLGPDPLTGYGSETEDRVYIPSVYEVERYFPTHQSRQAIITPYVREKGRFRDDIMTISWRLRTPGAEGQRIYSTYVRSNGEIVYHGGSPTEGIPVRPMIRVRLTDDAPASAVVEDYADEGPEAAERSVHPGDTVTLGDYNMDDIASNGLEPVEWQVLEVRDDVVTLLSRYALEALPYDAPGENATWANCTLHAWLNGDFLFDTFTPEEHDRLLYVTVDTLGEDPIDDQVYLLSTEEAYRCLRWAKDRVAPLTPHAEALDSWGSWWLRDHSDKYLTAKCVTPEGELDSYVIDITDPKRLVRPVIALALSDVEALMQGPAATPVPAPTEESAEEPAPVEAEDEPVEDEAPAEADLVDLSISALVSPAYRSTYDALRSGAIVQKGSKGDVAKGIQQMLVAFGQDITVDGDVGGRTIAALNAVQAAFGLPQTEYLNAEGYAALMPRLLTTVNPGVADVLLGERMDYDEYDYMKACAMCARGKYATARSLFESSGWGDWEARANACVQSWPKNGVLYKNPDVSGSSTELTVKVNTSPDNAMLVKIYTTNDVLARTMFIGGTGQATTSLPAGTYIIKDGTGHNWYGEEEAFGSEGYYEIMTFGDGVQQVELKRNYTSTITVNVQEDNPNAQGVGSDWESWDEF